MEEWNHRVRDDWFGLERHSRRVLAEPSLVTLVLVDERGISREIANMHTEAFRDDPVGMIGIEPDASGRIVGAAHREFAVVPLGPAGIAHVSGPGPLCRVTHRDDRREADGIILLHDNGDVLWLGICTAVLVGLDREAFGILLIDMAISISLVLADAIAITVSNRYVGNASTSIPGITGHNGDTRLLVWVWCTLEALVQ